MVLDIAGDIEPGKVQDAVVQKLTEFGAFAQLVDYPSREAYVQTGDVRWPQRVRWVGRIC